MTTVNGEREPGERVEEFVAALLLLKHPHGNRITPSRGDRGVDVRVWNADGYDIYQVKRYTRPLTANQATSVEASWNTFTAETLPVLPVRSWTLDWLEELTAGHGIRTHWMGGITLDGMAADNPALVEYYFGDGGQRLHRLMADALQGGRDVPQGAPGEDLLEAAVARQRSLAAALNEVDPFYRYDIQARHGRVWTMNSAPSRRQHGGTASTGRCAIAGSACSVTQFRPHLQWASCATSSPAPRTRACRRSAWCRA
ncbi:hypothetical protein ACFOY2_53565 [Nonomuraea purpurea]|uniref:Restriction endonuclease type IV Mrr domain-containing protein n=1 Tax=Nonomuraea purpurea TaxID=1849276 RepID=A0ABV8GTI3_9ACTN